MFSKICFNSIFGLLLTFLWPLCLRGVLGAGVSVWGQGTCRVSL